MERYHPAHRKNNKDMEKFKYIQEDDYICIPASLRSIGLKGSELIVAAIIFRFSLKDGSKFYGSIRYICEWVGLSRQAVITILQKLVKDGIIEKEEAEVYGVKRCYYTYIGGSQETLPVVKKLDMGSQETLQGVVKKLDWGSQETLPNNINNKIIKEDNNILTDVSSTDDTQTEQQSKDNEKEKTASAIPEKKAKKLESSDIAAAADPASRYGKFLLWMKQDTPYCYKNLTLPTEKQFEKLLNDYGGESVKDIVEEIENRKDKRKNYSNLNLTIKNWMKYRESKKQ